MGMSTEMDYEFYEPRYWGLDPVFSAKVKLNVCKIFTLKKYPGFQDVYCILNHPIGNVHILGDIISIVRRTKLIQYKVDDGTAVISCVQWRKSDDSDEGLCIPVLGQLVSMFGKISEFRNERQITISSVCLEIDPNVEPLFWLEVIKLKKEVYSKPFVLPPGTTDIPKIHLQEVIWGELKKWLEDNLASKNFTLKELEGDESIVECCLRALQGQTDISKSEVLQTVKLSIAKLPSNGAVIPTGGRRGRDQLYKVLQEKKLVSVIVKYMSRREESPKIIQLGVPEEWIIEHVRQTEYLRMVPRQTVVSAINSMVDNSIIYPIALKSYRLV